MLSAPVSDVTHVDTGEEEETQKVSDVMCVCVCMCVRLCVLLAWMCMYVYACACACVCACICACACACESAWMCAGCGWLTCSQLYICACACLLAGTCVCKCDGLFMYAVRTCRCDASLAHPFHPTRAENRCRRMGQHRLASQDTTTSGVTCAWRCCMLHVACCMVHVAWRMAHGAWRMLHGDGDVMLMLDVDADVDGC